MVIIDLNATEIAWLLGVIVVEISMNVYFTITIITRHPSMKLNFITLIANVALIVGALLGSLIVNFPRIDAQTDSASFQMDIFYCITMMSLGIIEILIPLICNKLAISHSKLVRLHEGVDYDIGNFSWRLVSQGVVLLGASGVFAGIVCLNYRDQVNNEALKSTLSAYAIGGGVLVIVAFLVLRLHQHIINTYYLKQQTE
ncbi:MAG: hypothetical protein LKJ69_04805 [Lactobacillus sp.]|nr:hypothetical protein [Lactobacillus sp.]